MVGREFCILFLYVVCSYKLKWYHNLILYWWVLQRFPVDITSYLGEAGARGEKLLTVINGMDCVGHDEIIPFTSCDTKPIDHDLFDRVFEVVPETSDEKGFHFFCTLRADFTFLTLFPYATCTFYLFNLICKGNVRLFCCS